MSKIYRRDLVVRGYECGPERVVTLPTVLSYMEHTRWHWIMDPSLGLVEALHRGCFFVVHRQTVALARSFGISTHLTVRAALRSVGRVRCEVHQDLVRDDGVRLATAEITAIWIGPNRRMARIPDVTRSAVTDQPFTADSAPAHPGLATSFLDPPQRVFEPRIERLIGRDVPDSAERHTVRARPSDCDMFGHVNGSNYLKYFEDRWQRTSTSADVEYRGQATAGDTLTVSSWDDASQPGDPPRLQRKRFALSRGEEVLCRAVLTREGPDAVNGD